MHAQRIHSELHTMGDSNLLDSRSNGGQRFWSRATFPRVFQASGEDEGKSIVQQAVTSFEERMLDL